ncbi:hypothetical protein [Azospirillum sp. TSO22-1]|uniref:hypothetical protein n=1 Tax=Azospirillum sp. TSO22-1 TaxID=716789 RepID=UPI0011B7C83A|nr:hypothetical protein [Azospirillum sp. TSO22-1]
MLTLIRHGRPNLLPWRWGRRSDFVSFLQEFNSVSIDPAWAPPDIVVRRVNAAGSVFCSTAARAHTSAEWLLVDRLPIIDARFAEAPVAVPPLPLAMPLSAWIALGRLAWLAGLGMVPETPRQACDRAEIAADLLTAAAQRHGSAALVGHGWFNRLIGTALLSRGWRAEPAAGHGYWAHRDFLPP